MDFESKLNRKKTGASKWQVVNTKNQEYSEDIIPLSVADMEFHVMDEVKQALHEAIDTMDPFGYQAPTKEYFNSFISWMNRHHHVDVHADWIVISHGVVEALIRCVKTFSRPHDGVIIFTPVYPPFFKAARCNDTHVVECEMNFCQDHYELDFDKFEQLAKDENNTMLILCSPHNPVGKVFTREELEKIVSICKQNNLILIADEIHHDLIMEGVVQTCLLQFLSSYDKMVVCTSASKSFNLAGLQTSNIVIPNEKMRRDYMKDDHFAINPLSMIATQSAYQRGDCWMRNVLQVIYQNYQSAAAFFDEYFPKANYPVLQGTYLMWVDMNSYFENEEEMFEFLYDKACFIVNKGSTFGKNGSGFMRINLALPQRELSKALVRLKNSYDVWKKI